MLPVPITQRIEQHAIISEIDRRFSIADAVEKTVDEELQQSERLRQSILKRAFEGKLVEQDATDEPAEKLLERIKAEKAAAVKDTKAKAGGKPRKTPVRRTKEPNLFD